MNRYRIRINTSLNSIEYPEVKASTSRTAISRAMESYGHTYGNAKLNFASVSVSFLGKIVKCVQVNQKEEKKQ